MRQLDQHALEEARAAEAQRRSRLGGKEYFDWTHRIRMTPLAIDDLVLLHNSSIEKSHNVKIDNRWLGPYRMRDVRDNGSYLLAELYGTKLRDSVAGNRLKRFFVRSEEEFGTIGEQRDEGGASRTSSGPSAELEDMRD